MYTDCERPPPILHGRSELSIDDEGIMVTAHYKCDAGYRLHGKSDLNCDTDSDQWDGDLPACQLGKHHKFNHLIETRRWKQIDFLFIWFECVCFLFRIFNCFKYNIETGNNSTISEIEPPEVIGTVAPGLTHEELQKPVEQPTTSGPNKNEIEAPSSQAPISEVEQQPGQETETKQTNTQKKRRRKGKVDIQEDNTIDADFASRLDMSCLEGSIAPTVPDAYIVEYIRY